MKIVIADDHPLFRSGVRNLLGTTEDLQLVGEASTGDEALELAAALQPELILMDIRMSGLNGIEATRLIKERFPHIEVLILTMFQDDQSVFTAMRAGAKGYVLKDADENELLQSIRMVGSGGAVFSADIAARMIHYFAAPKPAMKRDHPALAELSRREMEILECIAEGQSNAQIATRLFISIKTVANNISTILNKLQVSDRNEAKRLLQDSRED
ncbi:LuxR family transcriptional regulator [Paenibacillus stellifer]|uniref:LuxR family transcriptional regulator n=1 Tax=Paenibacillus stellifer TaxID=169760 RepID=A0A089LPH1_9BACL|nr:response regulator transcription factor [Paenibacillus stellifer]AIQ61985.1 LuxR family transcriptional regulator [Paenibacillus stellifer]